MHVGEQSLLDFCQVYTNLPVTTLPVPRATYHCVSVDSKERRKGASSVAALTQLEDMDIIVASHNPAAVNSEQQPSIFTLPHNKRSKTLGVIDDICFHFTLCLMPPFSSRNWQYLVTAEHVRNMV